MALTSEAVRSLLALLESSKEVDLEKAKTDEAGLGLLHKGRAEAFADAINWIQVAAD